MYFFDVGQPLVSQRVAGNNIMELTTK